jgi:hypothetical protein
MSHKIRLSLILVILLVPISIGTLFVWSSFHGAAITFRAEDLDRIQDYMTERDVEKALGCPPGDYCTDPAISEYFQAQYIDRPRGDLTHKDWLSDDGMIQVEFQDGTVCLKYFYPSIVARRNWLERIRSRLGI